MRVDTAGMLDARGIGLLVLVTAMCLLPGGRATAQNLTGSLIGTVKDEQGGALGGARVTVASPALIGGAQTVLTSDQGQLRFPSLPPGRYTFDVELRGFTPYHHDDLRIGAGATLERTVVLTIAGRAESLVVEGAGARIDARDPGFATRFRDEDQRAIPARRSSMFDLIRAAPGVSPTSPSSGSVTTISAFGSGTNENQFLFDGTNFTCPCSGVARAEPGVDFIQEVHVQSVGASAEYGNMQGAVINVITRQGGERLLFDSAYYTQTQGLTSRAATLPYLGASGSTSGYHRTRYRDLTATLGGPVVRDRLWFFAGYQYLRDHDSQPGTDPAQPRRYEQNKTFAKLTWRLTPGMRLEQSLHHERGFNSERPTIVTPFEAIPRRRISVPAITFGHLTQTLSANTVWDVRAGRFLYTQDDASPDGDPATPSRFDRMTGVTSGAPPRLTGVTVIRTTAKATLSHYWPGLLGVDHQWKVGGQVERGEHRATAVIPTGVRFIDDGGQLFQSVSADPSNVGGASLTLSGFASDAITIGDRLTITAGLRVDHSRAISQDLQALDANGQEVDAIVPGLGTVYAWNIVSPRLGAVLKLSADGRTVLRASYGRFSQGVLTGELELFHPGATPVTTRAFEDATGDYSRLVSVVDPTRNLELDRQTRAPRTDEYSVGVDREIGRHLAVAAAYVHKDGRHFIGWTDVGGQYVAATHTLQDGRSVPVSRLTSSTASRLFRLTNDERYFLSYHGLVVALEKRRSHGWQAFGSYTRSRAYGLQASSGTSAAGAQTSTVGPPNAIVFGRDPNELLNATGRLPNDRPHIFRLMGSVEVPRTGLVVAANLQHFTGKPWATATPITLPQGDVRILLESRGSQRLSSQTLLDVRLSRTLSFRRLGRIEVLVDVLNTLNDPAEEALATDNVLSPTFGRGVSFVDPRRAMIGIRLNLGT